MTQIEVTVETAFLTSDEPSGRYRVRVSANATVETLLRQLCNEANTPCKVDFYLLSKERSTLLRTDILADIGIHDGSYLIWSSEVVDVVKPSCHFNTFWFLATIAFLIGLAGIVAVCLIKFKSTDKITDYAVVFDAGSSHTSMFIYKWEGSKFNGTAVAAQWGKSCKSAGGAISSFVSNPSAAGKSLEPCLKMAENRIPKHKHSKTPIYLGATAGMRLLRESNATASEDIFESIRKTFSRSHFLLSNPKNMVRILSGEEEGTFSWISSNYATNAFNVIKYLPDNKVVPRLIVPTIGAMDLGGASTQISFIPSNVSDIPKGFSRATELFNHNYTLYTHSYLCYGVNEARRRVLANLIKEQLSDSDSDVISHPCLPTGYNTTKTRQEIFDSPCVSGKEGLEAFGSTINPTEDTVNTTYTFTGTSIPTQCSRLVTYSLFNFSIPCPYSRCSFNGVYQPPVTGLFYAFSSFYYVTSFLNLTSPENSTFSNPALLYAINVLCSKSWAELQKIPGDKKFLPLYCEQANYINILLGLGYHFSDKNWQNIHFVEKVFSTEIGWALGLVLDKSFAYPSNKPEKTMYTLTFSLLIILFTLFILSAIGFIIHGFRARKNRSDSYRRLDSYGAI